MAAFLMENSQKVGKVDKTVKNRLEKWMKTAKNRLEKWMKIAKNGLEKWMKSCMMLKMISCG